MSVDKFGHFSNSDSVRKNDPKILGFGIDRHYNIDVKNKKIKNLAPPSEDTDAINRAYLQAQITRSQAILKNEMKPEFIDIRSEIAQIKNSIKDLLKVVGSMSTTRTIIYNDHN